MVFVAHKYMPDQIPVDELRATFAARHHTLRYLVKSLRNQAHARTLTSYLITGPRGSGKTTLIRMLCLKLEKVAELRQAWLPVRFPEELPTVTSLRDLLGKTLEILAEADIPGAQDWHQRVEEQDDEAQGQDIAIAGLQWIAREQNRRLVLFIENLDLVFDRGLTHTTQATLRRLLMTEPFMMIIGSAVRPFPELQSYDKAFFNYFCPVELEPLSEEQAYKILKRRAKWDGNKDFEQQQHEHRGKIRAISFLTGGNPRLLLMLYEILTHHEVQSAVQALRRLVDELTPLLKDILEHQLAKQQVKVVDALMQLDGNATPSQLAGKSRLSLNIVTSQLKRLEEARIVEVTGGGKGRPAWYSIRDRLFYTWYQMRYLQPGRRRIELFVQVLQIWFEADERMQRLHDLCATSESCDKAHVVASAEAAEYFAASLAKTQHEELAQRMAVKAHLKAGQPELAVSLFGEFESETPEGEAATSGYAGLTRWLREHGDLQEAIELARTRAQEDPDNTGLLLEYGLALGLSGDHAGALSRFDRLVGCPETNVVDKASAFLFRAAVKAELGDTAGEIADYTAVIDLQGAPSNQVARALYRRGLAKGAQGDIAGEIADYSSVVRLQGVAPELVALVLYTRGLIKGIQGDIEGASADWTDVVESRVALPWLVADALYDRSILKDAKGDIDGAVADWTATIDLPGAPPERIAMALNNRGVSKRMQGDTAGAIADFTAAIDFQDAPADEIAKALYNRGVVRGMQGDRKSSIMDLVAVACTPEATSNIRIVAGARGIREALAEEDDNATDEITAALQGWLTQLDNGERTQRIMECLATLADLKAREAWLYAFRELLKGQPEETTKELEFLKPAAEVLETGDMSKLDALAPEQRDFALHVLGKLGLNKSQGD